MPKVETRKYESFDSLLKRFKKVVDRSGLIIELRNREHYKKPSDERKRKQAAAKARERSRVKNGR